MAEMELQNFSAAVVCMGSAVGGHGFLARRRSQWYSSRRYRFNRVALPTRAHTGVDDVEPPREHGGNELGLAEATGEAVPCVRGDLAPAPGRGAPALLLTAETRCERGNHRQ